MKIKSTKISLSFLILMMMLSLFSCMPQNKNTCQKQTKKLKIITTLFPQYDFAKQIAGDKADVSLLLPPGVEAHSFEPTPKNITDIQKADLFIYTNAIMEPWAVKIAQNTRQKSVQIIDASQGITFLKKNDSNENMVDHHEENPHHEGVDPHIWLDPILAKQMVDTITNALIQKDQKNKNFYSQNALTSKNKLDQLDQNFSKTFEKVQSKKIIYGGHVAFGYFAKRYGLTFISPYQGFSPNAEPTPRRIAELMKAMQKTSLKTIYFEELVDPKVARVIAAQTGAKMVLLHGAHNMSKSELNAGVTYLEIMQNNLEKLKEGLGYKK